MIRRRALVPVLVLAALGCSPDPPPAATGRPAPDLGPESTADLVIAGTLSALAENRPPLTDPALEDFRGPGEAAAAAARPAGRPLGGLVVFRPGLDNIHPSPAFLFRLAAHSGRLLVAWGNARPGALLGPVVATAIDGVPVPPSLAGRIFTSGHPAPRMVPWTAGADLLLAQIESLDGSPFLAGRALDRAGLVVVAHSQGGLEALDVRRRLRAAGRGAAIGRVVSIDSPFGGSPMAERQGFGALVRLVELDRVGRTPEAIDALSAGFIGPRIGPADADLVDLAVVGATDGARPERLRLVLRTLADIHRASSPAFAGQPGDGLVTVASMSFGRRILRLPDAHDHASVIEDPAVVDAIAGVR